MDGGRGSSGFRAMRSLISLGELAQLGERLVCNQEVTGSIPVFSTTAGLRMPAPGSDGPVAGIRKRIVRFFDNRFGKVAKALGEKTIFYGQATKGIRWMPWRTRAMKDAVSCDKPR